MKPKPRIGYAKLDERAHLHAPMRYLPIIVVPGVAGTRLTDPKTGKLAWNPYGVPLGHSAGVFAADFDRLSQVSADLVPDETHTFEEGSEQHTDAKQVKHYYNVLQDVYGDLANGLAKLDQRFPDMMVKPKVYCCGYDWRQDNAQSALRLAAVVEEALRETRERRVIIVAHSMGGQVARYYARVLGGESKIHRLYLVGAPTLGAPGAYLSLKRGLPGLYVKDMIEAADEGDGGAVLGEGIEQAGMLTAGIVGWAGNPGQSATTTVASFAGDLFIAFSLGAGRLLRRTETKRFARQVPALYQLIPSGVYCREHKNWLIFDPASTGYPPTGLMITLPSLFDLLAEACGPAFKAFIRPEDAQRTSPRATRNVHTLVQRLEAIASSVAVENDYTPEGEVTQEGFSRFAANEKQAIVMTLELVERLRKTFLDGRNNRQLYSDIFTGLLDEVDQRAVCAANLALGLRFDEALTVDPHPEAGVSGFEYLMDKVIVPFFASLQGIGALLFLSHSELDDSDADEPVVRPAPTPRIYMHPRTVNIWTKTLPVEAGAVIIPTNVYSNDDSNVVKWMSIPSALALPAMSAVAGGASLVKDLEDQAVGDGTVPAPSCHPPPEQLSHPFLEEHEVETKVSHQELPHDADVVAWIGEHIASVVPDFLAT
jgi:pimeloyl-ACP methyl ester carboxylesterase